MITVFSKSWFAKYNKQLCWIANSFIGQFVFNFRKFGHYPENKIVRITPNSIDEFIGYKGDRLELKAHFFGRNEYALRLQKVFMPIWLTFHIWDIITRPIPQLNLGFDTLEVYPAVGANSPVDGYVQRIGADQTLANIRAGAGTNNDGGTGTASLVQLRGSTTADQFERLSRALTFFDTSPLTADATITVAVLSLYGSAKANGLGSQNIHVATGNAASDAAIASADYAQANFGTTTFGNVAYADYSTVAYNDITLNASGLAHISLTSLTRFSEQTDWDINNNFTGTWADSGNSYYQFYFADNGSNKPKLVVTYTLPVIATAGFLFLMV